MKNERLLTAIGSIDSDLVAGAESVERSRRRGGFRWAAAAACLAAALLGGAVLLRWQASTAPTADLPILTVPDSQLGTMGFEGYLAYDVSELLSGNPWTENTSSKTLPVYRNPVTYNGWGAPVSGMDREAMTARLLEVAERLGLDAKQLEITDNAPGEEERAAVREKFGGEIPEGYFAPTEVSAEGGGMKITVEADLTARINFNPAIGLPEGYNFNYRNVPYGDMQDVAKYLKEQYSGLLAMENPRAEVTGGDYTFNGEQGYSVMVYDAAGSATNRIVNFNFNTARFSCDEEGKLWIIRLNRPDLSRKVGDYPIITAEEAEKLLCAGNYITTVPSAMPGREYIAKAELVYRTGRLDEYFMPYYRFYVELPDMERDGGLKTFGAFYVPAVEGQYLSGLPLWNGSFN